MSTPHTGSIRSESRLSTADSDSSSDHYQVQLLYQDQQPPSEPSMNSKYTTRPISMMPATKALNVQGGVKLRPRSLVVYTTQLPPVSDDSSQFSGSSSASDSSSTASSRSSAQEPPALKRYTLTDNPVRMQPHSQPAHRSKLSKQYTPSESEGSDDDRSDQAQSQRRRPRATGGPKELNSSVAAESLRVKKKMSFAKRISRLFGASKSTKIPSTATQPVTIAPASAAPPSSSASAKSDSHRSSAISRAGTPSLEVIDELGGQELRRPQVYMHPRSQSSPNMVRRNGQSMCNNSGSNGNLNRYSMMAQDTSGLKTRDNGFEDDEASGHRRYSSANGPSTSASGVGSRVSAVNPIQRQRALSANKYPTIGNRSSVLVGGHLYTDQQQPQHADHYDNKHDSSGTPPSPHSRHPSDTDTCGTLGMIAPLSEDQKRQRRATILDAPSHLVYQPQMTAPSRRSSTPVVISETLVSRIDREKSTKCFQTPVPVRDTYSRDAKLDPALSNLVQQHLSETETPELGHIEGTLVARNRTPVTHHINTLSTRGLRQLR
ncbi:hypothetical protein BGZ72_006059 [Mortierella alpina]|nr:hypothetical protein BGZ72_006059 [Mortierella alpina]